MLSQWQCAGAMQLLFTTTLVCVAARATGLVCEPGLGCFPNGTPWNTAKRPIPPPRSREDIGTYFTHYTRKTQYTGYNITSWPSISLDGSDYQANRSTIFIVQGLTRSWNVTWLYQLKNNILNKGDFNVILTHWGRGGDPSYNYTYYQAVADTRVAGAELARLGRFLISHQNVLASSFHVIGHSLGAQIAGYMGKNITGLGRITGLDATQVGYVGYPAEVRLDSSDAELVEDIHTALQPSIPNLINSTNREIGHVDFYLNGGNVQPGCNLLNKTLQSVEDYAVLSPAEVSNMSGCSHQRSVKIFLEATSSSDCIFWGRMHLVRSTREAARIQSPCSALSMCRPIGLDSYNFTAVGRLDVETTSTKPYCIPCHELRDTSHTS